MKMIDYGVDRSKLLPGMWVHERGSWFLSRTIRFFLNRWEWRVWAKYRKALQPIWKRCPDVWGNHDGIILPPLPGERDWAVGEAIEHGSVRTPLSDYESQIRRGLCEIRFFKPTICDEATMAAAADYWQKHIYGRPYDYQAYWGLIWDCLVASTWNTSRKGHFYCTEGIADAYLGVGVDVLQDDTPAPFHVEQVAGLLPASPRKKITLKEVIAAV